MFKALVKSIAEISTEEDYSTTCGTIDRAFDQEKISWADHELLYSLLSKIKIA